MSEVKICLKAVPKKRQAVGGSLTEFFDLASQLQPMVKQQESARQKLDKKFHLIKTHTKNAQSFVELLAKSQSKQWIERNQKLNIQKEKRMQQKTLKLIKPS